MKTCSSCGSTVNGSRGFCEKCGLSFMNFGDRFCLSCGEKNSADSEVCMNCNASLVPPPKENSPENAPPPEFCYCSHCGLKYDSSTVYCSKCGRNLLKVLKSSSRSDPKSPASSGGRSLFFAFFVTNYVCTLIAYAQHNTDYFISDLITFLFYFIPGAIVVGIFKLAQRGSPRAVENGLTHSARTVFIVLCVLFTIAFSARTILFKFISDVLPTLSELI